MFAEDFDARSSQETITASRLHIEDGRSKYRLVDSTSHGSNIADHDGEQYGLQQINSRKGDQHVSQQPQCSHPNGYRCNT